MAYLPLAQKVRPIIDFESVPVTLILCMTVYVISTLTAYVGCVDLGVA